jgi:hypothetical protein
MSYTLTLQCGCVVYVARNPATHVAHTRILQSRGQACTHRRHEVGLRLYLWELLPPRPNGQATAYDQDVTLVTPS